MKASNTIRQKRQQIIDKNVNRTQTQEQKSLFNKRDTKKTKKSFFPKIHKKGGWKKMGAFDGGINQTYTETDLSATEQTFNDVLLSGRELRPIEAKELQHKAQENPKWRWWVLAFHPKMWKKIMGVVPSSKEMRLAMEKWVEMEDIEINLKLK